MKDLTAHRSPTGKVESVFHDALYRVATGVWQPGHRLPSLRQAGEAWGVSELTCLRAYQRLVAIGVVRAHARGGYYVAESRRVARISRHGKRLRELYAAFERSVRRSTGISVLGAARAIAQLAEMEAAQRPECAFVECTRFQAEGHAREVRDRLGVPCMALTTAEIGEGGADLPAHVRTLLTTRFHFGEVSGLAAERGVGVIALPIEIDPDFVADLRHTVCTEAHVLALDRSLATSIARDLSNRIDRDEWRFHAAGVRADAIAPTLERLLAAEGGARGVTILLSPTLWSVAPEPWQRHDRVRPFIFRVRESAWSDAAEAVGLFTGVSAGESMPRGRRASLHRSPK